MTDWLNEEEFNAVAYSYRAWPTTDPAGVIARFEELKQFIRNQVEMLIQDEAEASADHWQRVCNRD